MFRKSALFLMLLLMAFQLLDAQDTITSRKPVGKVKAADSAQVAKHSPMTAMLLSIIPGGGQIYNRKYWKLPIVYGCLAGSGYFLYYSADKMLSFRNEYIYRMEGNESLLNPEYAQYPNENIIELKNKYRRYLEVAVGITAIFYALNIIDARVDAHLYYFDISDDLSLQWSPALMPSLARNTMHYGISLQLRW